jgi:hypothetical protein
VIYVEEGSRVGLKTSVTLETQDYCHIEENIYLIDPHKQDIHGRNGQNKMKVCYAFSSRALESSSTGAKTIISAFIPPPIFALSTGC